MPRTITQAEYIRVLNEQNADFCDCCGDKVLIAGLFEADMPDFSRPEGNGMYPLVGGFTVCRECGEHADGGPCRPERVVQVEIPPIEFDECI